MSMRESLKKRSAQLGYSIGFGTRRHFATYDIVEKTPAYFGVITFALGIIFLTYKNDGLANLIGATTSIIGFALFYLNFYLNERDKYVETGKKLNILYGKVHSVYEKSKICPDVEIPTLENELININDEFQNISIHKQVFFSNELAHFKLFGESHSDWFADELKLTFWKDKIPAIWRIYLIIFSFIIAAYLLLHCEPILKTIGCVHAS